MARRHEPRANKQKHARSLYITTNVTSLHTYLLAARERGSERVGVQVLAGGHVLQPHDAAARYRLSDLARQGSVALFHLAFGWQGMARYGIIR